MTGKAELAGGIVLSAFGSAAILIIGIVTVDNAIHSKSDHQRETERKTAIQQMNAMDVDGQIDNFLMTRQAFLDCRAIFEQNKRERIPNVNVPYRALGSGFSSRTEAVEAMQSEGCLIRYGERPMPFCGYGDCWAVALLIVSTIVAA